MRYRIRREVKFERWILNVKERRAAEVFRRVMDFVDTWGEIQFITF